MTVDLTTPTPLLRLPQVLLVELLLLLVLIGSLVSSAAYLTYNYRMNRLEALHQVQAGAMSFKRGISRLGSRLGLDEIDTSRASSFILRATSFISRSGSPGRESSRERRESSRDGDGVAPRVHRAARYTETRRQFSDASRCTASDRTPSELRDASSSRFTAVVPVLAPSVGPSAEQGEQEEAAVHAARSGRSSQRVTRGESRGTRVRIGTSGGSGRSSSVLSVDGISCTVLSAVTQVVKRGEVCRQKLRTRSVSHVLAFGLLSLRVLYSPCPALTHPAGESRLAGRARRHRGGERARRDESRSPAPRGRHGAATPR